MTNNTKKISKVQKTLDDYEDEVDDEGVDVNALGNAKVSYEEVSKLREAGPNPTNFYLRLKSLKRPSQFSMILKIMLHVHNT